MVPPSPGPSANDRVRAHAFLHWVRRNPGADQSGGTDGDPKTLRRRIAELERELRRQAIASVDEAELERRVEAALASVHEEYGRRLAKAGQAMAGIAGDLTAAAGALEDMRTVLAESPSAATKEAAPTPGRLFPTICTADARAPDVQFTRGRKAKARTVQAPASQGAIVSHVLSLTSPHSRGFNIVCRSGDDAIRAMLQALPEEPAPHGPSIAE